MQHEYLDNNSVCLNKSQVKWEYDIHCMRGFFIFIFLFHFWP